MPFDKLVFRVHAIQRMFQRKIGREEVNHALKTGEVIEEYLDDLPYPSRLILGWSGSRPLHVVAADNQKDCETIIVTAYEPDSLHWEVGFTQRKS